MKKKTKADYPEDRSGCGIERVAEITGRSYSSVRKAWITHCNGNPNRLSAVGNGAGLPLYDIAKLLDLFGHGVVPLVAVKGPAIILLIDEHNSGHYVRLTKEGRVED